MRMIFVIFEYISIKLNTSTIIDVDTAFSKIHY